MVCRISLKTWKWILASNSVQIGTNCCWYCDIYGLRYVKSLTLITSKLKVNMVFLNKQCCNRKVFCKHIDRYRRCPLFECWILWNVRIYFSKLALSRNTPKKNLQTRRSELGWLMLLPIQWIHIGLFLLIMQLIP